MTKSLKTLLGMLLFYTYITKGQETNIHKIFIQLDNELKQSPKYLSKKEAEMQRLKNNIKMAVAPLDKFLSSKQIAIDYTNFDSDSALYYYQKCIELGEKHRNKIWIQDAVVSQSYILADRGDNFLAISILQNLGDTSQIFPELKTKYAKAMIMSFVRITSDTYKLFPTLMAKEVWEAYSRYIPISDPLYYLTYTVAYPKYNPEFVREKIRLLLQRQNLSPSEKAMSYMTIGLTYEKENKLEEAITAKSKGAIIDIREVNRNSTSMIMLIEDFLKCDISDDEITDLIKYSNFCIDNASSFKDVGRSIHLVNSLKHILQLYEKRTQRAGRHQLILDCLIGALLLAACFGIGYFYWTRKKIRISYHSVLKNQKTALETIKDQEKQLIETQSLVRKLEERSMRVDGFQLQFFSYLSHLVSDAHNFKKEIGNLVSSGQLANAKRYASQNFSKDNSLAMFLSFFDEAFLFVYPNFPELFNAPLRAEAQIAYENQQLSPELRIYALIFMGIDESKIIAEILHYSVQTVYNYRLKVRKSCINQDFRYDEYIAGLNKKRK